MAGSYDIYLHAVNVSGNYNPTTPWSQREASGGAAQTGSAGSIADAGKNAAYSISRAAGYMQNPDAIAGAGVAAISRSLPWVAAAYAVVKLGESIADNVVEFNEINGGDYRGGNQWRDFKQAMNNIFHPFSVTLQAFKTAAQWDRQNKKARAEQELLGGSVINSYINRGV